MPKLNSFAPAKKMFNIRKVAVRKTVIINHNTDQQKNFFSKVTECENDFRIRIKVAEPNMLLVFSN